ncbi:MAG TPA: hypothetical protein VGE26_10175, partial [Sphingobacteriaceae bacterium]
KSSFSIAFVSIYLLIYLVLFNLDVPVYILFGMYLFSPFLVIWMVYTVIRYGIYTGRGLMDDEEWGYEDKKREDIGTFF